MSGSNIVPVHQEKTCSQLFGFSCPLISWSPDIAVFLDGIFSLEGLVGHSDMKDNSPVRSQEFLRLSCRTKWVESPTSVGIVPSKKL